MSERKESLRALLPFVLSIWSNQVTRMFLCNRREETELTGGGHRMRGAGPVIPFSLPWGGPDPLYVMDTPLRRVITVLSSPQ